MDEKEMTNEIKQLNAAETAKLLYESGLLFAINRNILHPFSLALAVRFDDGKEDPTEVVLFDSREADDHSQDGGYQYAANTFLEGLTKFESFLQKEGKARVELRKKVLDYIIQPIPHSEVVAFDVLSEPVSSMEQIAKTTVQTDNSTQVKKPAQEPSLKKGAAYRKDLVAETPSFSSKVKDSGLALSGQAGEASLPNERETPTRKIDISKMKLINKTKLTSACTHPDENIANEPLGTGGRVLFCSACGGQFVDSDLSD